VFFVDNKFVCVCFQHCNVRQASLQRGQSEAHYRAVCRALVAEALELASFLERVSQGTQSLPCVQVDPDTCHDLDQLKFTDWVSTFPRVTDLRQITT